MVMFSAKDDIGNDYIFIILIRNVFLLEERGKTLKFTRIMIQLIYCIIFIVLSNF